MFRSVALMGRSAATLARGFRMWMPTMPMVLIYATNATSTHAAKAIFRVLPKMTKHEIKEYLSKIYQLPVSKVRTMNYLGKRKKVLTREKIHYYKYRDFKKAIVTFDKSITDLGLGTRIYDWEDPPDEQDQHFEETMGKDEMVDDETDKQPSSGTPGSSIFPWAQKK